uniref:Uncharacterized protein n=1 Tax=Strongyloides venezuelensis TaxID=75913 RepID=A0A0K0FQ59_STRVS
MFNFAKETITPPSIQDLKVQMELLNRIRLVKRKIVVRNARSNKIKVKKVVIKEIAKIKNPCVVANEYQDGRKNKLISAYKFRVLKDQ